LRSNYIELKTLLHFILFLSFIGCNSTADKDDPVEQPQSKTELSQKQKIIFFGNSITAAYQLDPKDAFSNIIQAKIDSLNLNYECINAGNSGETTAGGVNRLDWVLKNGCAIFVLELGANDGLRGLPLENTEQNLNVIIDKVFASYPDCKVLVCGMKVPPSMGDTYSLQYDEMFARISNRKDIAFLPFILEGVAGIPELNLKDGIHPTVEGHQILAETVWLKLKSLL
jgi:acyl-CoA thioesterase-1